MLNIKGVKVYFKIPSPSSPHFFSDHSLVVVNEMRCDLEISSLNRSTAVILQLGRSYLALSVMTLSIASPFISSDVIASDEPAC